MILIFSIKFSKKKCEDDSLSITQIKSTNIKTNNSDIEHNSTNKPNDDPKIKEKSPTKFKQLDQRVSPERIVDSTEKLVSRKIIDKSVTHQDLTSKTEYDPTKKNYDPIKDAIWDHGQP